MIVRGRGDLLAADVEALVNAVNCVGVMGRGLAAQFKAAYPDNFAEYRAACGRGEVVVGRVLVHRVAGAAAWPRFVVNVPTKRHWRSGSRLEDVRSGLAALREAVVAEGIGSVAVPALGCGLGGLAWGDVRPLVEEALGGLAGVEVRVWEPQEEEPGGGRSRGGGGARRRPVTGVVAGRR